MIQRVLTRGKSPIDARSDDRNMSVLARITHFRYACAPVMERYRKIMAVTDADLVAKLSAFWAWAGTEPRITGAIPWHWGDLHPKFHPASPRWGGDSYPKTLAWISAKVAQPPR